ncbi:hypothetical protein XM53_19590 [Roseovarius atlanticus]|uniref:Uncharacterized protein n=1 Tax=Roseovarius atlanticus TaxID=1641875 RepID=A0A0T5NPJ8_9RHOB|nr:hypothetical protein [Roseovarius atlanticus]KRS10737.1 hypothetical protein XM53_19590 [Roseovarius atlanticus]
MTALSEYERLEASGLWRASPDAQRVDVYVSLGDATLTILDRREQPLTHWSLAAIARANPGKRPALYHPDGDAGETLELGEDASEVIDAIERLRAAVDRARPHPGRLRLVMFLGSLAAVAALATLWLPGALRDHATKVLPQVKREEIGDDLRRHIERVTGPACDTPDGRRALTALADRLPAGDDPGTLDVMRDGVKGAVALPGKTILLDRALVEDYEEPDVLAGYIVEQRLRADVHDPIDALLQHAGTWDSIRLLTTGELTEDVLADYARHLLTRTEEPLPDETLLNGFASWSVRSTPYAYALDVTGESTLGLIEADPFASEAPPPILSDADWLRLQGICGG